MTELKVPVTKSVDWFTFNCPSGHGRDANWTRIQDGGAGHEVSRMVIHDLAHAADDPKKIGRWQLWLFTDESDKDDNRYAARKVDLGNTLGHPELDDAILAAVTIGSAESGGGDGDVRNYMVSLNFTGTSVIDIAARTPEEAVSLARRRGLSGSEAFFDNLEEVDKDHNYDNISAVETTEAGVPLE